MIFLEEFEGSYKGERAILIFGGPSTPWDLRKCPNGVLIGVNNHATILKNLEFIVFSDFDVYPLIAKHNALKITTCTEFKREQNCIWAGISPCHKFSGELALWSADYMGFDEILICGADCYDGGRDYWHDLKQAKEHHKNCDRTDFWKPVKRLMKHPEKVKVMNPESPLKGLFA